MPAAWTQAAPRSCTSSALLPSVRQRERGLPPRVTLPGALRRAASTEAAPSVQAAAGRSLSSPQPAPTSEHPASMAASVMSARRTARILEWRTPDPALPEITRRSHALHVQFNYGRGNRGLIAAGGAWSENPGTGLAAGMTALIRIDRSLTPATEGDRSRPIRFCSRCGHPSEEPARRHERFPRERVCRRCGMGMMLTSSRDALPGTAAAFLVVTFDLRVSAVSEAGEKIFGREQSLMSKPLLDLLSSPLGNDQLAR